VRLCLGAERIKAGWRRRTGRSGDRRCMVTAESPGAVSCARWRPAQSVKWCLWLTSGP
jgi:hypothetical protein